jgi:2-C-methyl-D-erythritol 4-phosphate cytidylyltransferase
MGKPVIAWSIDAFIKNSKISQVIVVYHSDDKELFKQLSGNIQGVIGGPVVMRR